MYRAGQEEIDAVAEVIRSKQWFRYGNPEAGHTAQVERFEREWAEMMGAKYALLMCGGGTAALTAALAGLGIGPGDEVIVPAYTWQASASAVLSAGAIPVLAEVDETLTLDVEDFEERIGPRTRAVIPVHMAGHPCNMEKIVEIANKHNLKVVEDSCQMVGGKYHGRRTGTWGDVGAYSFNQYKNISAGGEGGCLVTSDRNIYDRALVFHDAGAAFRQKAEELTCPIFVSQQFRADEVMGAIARVQMGRLDGILEDLGRNRDRIAGALVFSRGAGLSPSHDPKGDCGSALALRFDTEEAARAFCGQPDCGGSLVFESGKHVYTRWEALREKRIGHHPAVNPFNFPQNAGLRVDFSEEACPRTLEIIKRSVHVMINPDWSEEQMQERIEAMNAAFAAI